MSNQSQFFLEFTMCPPPSCWTLQLRIMMSNGAGAGVGGGGGTYVSAITVRVWRERKGKEVGGEENETIIMARRG